MESLPPTRELALRLGLVSRAQIVAALVRAVETPASGLRVVAVAQIKALHSLSRFLHERSDTLRVDARGAAYTGSIATEIFLEFGTEPIAFDDVRIDHFAVFVQAAQVKP